MMSKKKAGGGATDKLQVLLKGDIEGVGKANTVVMVVFPPPPDTSWNPHQLIIPQHYLQILPAMPPMNGQNISFTPSHAHMFSRQVNTGYFNNFLRPKALGTIISDEEVAERNELRQEELAAILQTAVDQAAQLKSMGAVILKRKMGAGGKIFGNVTHKQIMEAIKEQTGGKVDLTLKQKMTIPEVTAIGSVNIDIQLHPSVSHTVRLDVVEEK